MAEPAVASGSSSAPRRSADDQVDLRRRLVRLLSGDFLGVQGRLVEVQVDVSERLNPAFTIVGLPGKSTRESRDRIQAALQNSGFSFPLKDRITVNLAPAFQKKEGMVFDLPVAIGILLGSGQVPLPDRLGDGRARPGAGEGQPLPIGFVGELGLQGELRPVPGALLIASALRDSGARQIVVPFENAAEAAWTPDLEVLAAANLRQALGALCGALGPWRPDAFPTRRLGAPPPSVPDFAEVRGQEATKRGLLVAAAGAHNVLLIGPPGVGKTMLARRLPGVLPPLSHAETLEVLRVRSAAGLLDDSAEAACGRRPFRAPHHTVSYAGLVGGGNPPRPGELSLAHRGVLFLDELPEFPRRVLETLRQPMESGTITIARASGVVSFPASALIVAAMNPCPCGWAGAEGRGRCRCSPAAIHTYRQRISGPLLDRIDLVLELPQPPAAEVLGEGVAGARPGLSTAALADLVQSARAAQEARWGAGVLNGSVAHETLLRRGLIGSASRRLLAGEARRLGLSGRSLGRVLRLARTLADLAGAAEVDAAQVREALFLRRPAET